MAPTLGNSLFMAEFMGHGHHGRYLLGILHNFTGMEAPVYSWRATEQTYVRRTDFQFKGRSKTRLMSALPDTSNLNLVV